MSNSIKEVQKRLDELEKAIDELCVAVSDLYKKMDSLRRSPAKNKAKTLKED